MIIPFKLDIEFYRLPWVTCTIIGLCLSLHYYFNKAERELVHTTYEICKENPEFFSALKKANEAAPSILQDFKFRNCDSALYYLNAQGNFLDKIQDNEDIDVETGEYLAEVYEEYVEELSSRGKIHYAQYFGDYSLLRTISSSFLHADWPHVLGNVYFLWIFGALLELCIGSLGYLIYILYASLFVGTSMHILGAIGLLDTSRALFSLGASDFIFAILGTHIVLFRNIKVHTVFFVIFRGIYLKIPSWFLVGIYLFKEVFYLSVSQVGTGSISAHLLGASFGIVLGLTTLKKYKY
jgi:membrane associated rhomboid family serine protease